MTGIRFDEILKDIAAALRQAPGTAVAALHNSVCHPEMSVEYIGGNRWVRIGSAKRRKVRHPANTHSLH